MHKISLLIFTIALVFSVNSKAFEQKIILKDFNLQDNKISLYIPKDLKESFITSDDSIYISYGTERGEYSVVFKFTKLSDTNAAYLKQDHNFKNTALIPYEDKEKYLYGKYKIIDYRHDNSFISLHTQSFLRKASDNYMPEAYFALMDYFELNKNILTTISCRASGSYANKTSIDALFDENKAMCSDLIEKNKGYIRNIANVLK